MSILYRARWELVFLVKHAKGPKMTVASAAKYLKKSRWWAENVLQQFEEQGNVDFSEDRGPDRATTDKEDLQMVKLATRGKPKTTEEISQIMSNKGVSVSRWTVGRRLREQGLRFGALLKKPLLTKPHIEKRLLWAKENLDRDWTRVIFTDKSTFALNCQVTRAWKKRGNPSVYRSVKHPPKVNVWGCFSAKGFGELVIIPGILESQKMILIYTDGLLPSARQFYGTRNKNWYLLEDNDPKHRSKLCKSWKEENGVKVMDWPAQSPDCNPIENVWGLMKARLRQRKIVSNFGLIRAIKEEWRALEIEYAEKLAQSCARRCQAVLANNGDWIPY